MAQSKTGAVRRCPSDDLRAGENGGSGAGVVVPAGRAGANAAGQRRARAQRRRHRRHQHVSLAAGGGGDCGRRWGGPRPPWDSRLHHRRRHPHHCRLGGGGPLGRRRQHGLKQSPAHELLMPGLCHAEAAAARAAQPQGRLERRSSWPLIQLMMPLPPQQCSPPLWLPGPGGSVCAVARAFASSSARSWRLASHCYLQHEPHPRPASWRAAAHRHCIPQPKLWMVQEGVRGVNNSMMI